MLGLQHPGLKTLDRWFQYLSMVSDGKDLLHLSRECGETHEMQIRDKTALQEETQTGRGALGENSEALAYCTVKDGMEQE